MQRTPSGALFFGKSLALTGYLSILGLLAGVSFTAAAARERVLLDSCWRFQLGDPVDVTANVTVYPEISYLPKLNSSDINAETALQATRPDPVAMHAGENVSFVMTNYNDGTWRALDLPHDWVVELPFVQSVNSDVVAHGSKPVGDPSFTTNNIGWYRHTFTLPAGDAGKTMWLEFDGIYRNALIWLNGRCLGRDVSGYASISFDVTTNLIAGGTNVLVVRVDASRFEGWFYEGAGIYRHGWLVKTDPVHVAHWGTYVATTSLVGSNATLTVQTMVTNQSGASTVNATLTSTLLDANSNAVTAVTSNLTLVANQGLIVTQTLSVANASLWSLDTPYLYNLVSTVSNQTIAADIYVTPFGVRTVSFDGVNGVLINGKHVEIQGTCNHQDHAGVGTALPDRLQYFRIEKLKQMGDNAYRTSHNAPTPELLDACDRLGMLVLDETRRFGWDSESLGQLERMIRRDRNHPSVFAWSLANEEPMQNTAQGASVMQTVQNLAHSLDSTRKCTAAIVSFGSSGFDTVLDVAGINYNTGQVSTSYHNSHPYIIGTEQGSTVTTRGIYTNDVNVNAYVASYDIITTTKSGLLQNPVTWGSTAENWWPLFYNNSWSSGGFNWTGFDYRGEPTPFTSWPSISSHFGVMDACGFPKDLYYYYQANWSPKTVLHVFPHWNWSTPGQIINVWAYGNCQAVELFTNGVSLGRQTLNVRGHVSWNVPYSAGTLQAVGYNNSVAVITNTVVTTGTPAAIALWPDRSTILADGRDVSLVTVAALDSQGRVVPTATNNISFSITGGTIIGVGNGDPSSHEADKASSQRKVFNGFAQVIVQSTNQPGSITLTATAAGLTSTNITVNEAATLPAPPAPVGISAVAGNSQVVVSWDVVPGATTYNLLRATTGGGPYSIIATNLGSLGYTDNDVTNFVTYYYVATATGNGAGPNSAEVNATTTALVSGLTATSVNGQITLSWNASPGANYNVKRSTVTGGPYTPIATAIASTNFTDVSATTCQTYFYVVTITNAGNESLNSAEVSDAVLPAPFQNQDVGAVGSAGSASYCSGQYTVSGSGADIWGTADAFQFVYTYLPVSTNCDIRARVVSVQNTSGNAKAAVMIRESLAANSRHAMADVEPITSTGIEFIWRTNTSGNSTSASATGLTAPYWIRLTRTNNTFQAYRSPDGNTWTQIGSAVTLSMSNNAYVGLAVCSHAGGVLCSSMLDNVTLLAPHPTNTPPVLNPIASQTVNVGQTVAFTASATDTDQPPQTLTFNLLAGPGNAALNTNSGAFTWRPLVTQANTTNTFTLMVADNGSPSLSATQSFSVKVNPLALPSMSSVTVNNGQLTLQVTNSIVGPDYAVLESSNLNNWSTLFITNSPPTNFFQWTDTNAASSPAQFYRIKIGPPLP